MTKECAHSAVMSAASKDYRRTWCGHCGETLPHEALEVAWRGTDEPSVPCRHMQPGIAYDLPCKLCESEKSKASLPPDEDRLHGTHLDELEGVHSGVLQVS